MAEVQPQGRRSSREAAHMMAANAPLRVEQAQIGHAMSARGLQADDYQERAMFCFDREAPIRRLCIEVIRHPMFDRAVVFFIILNCVFLAMNDPLDINDESTRNKIVEQSEDYFLGVFTVEMCVKIMAMGFVGKNSYMAERWNWIDFVVVTMGWIAKVGVDNVSALRTFRVLRPLRTLTSIPGMRVIVHSMLASIPALFNVFLLCVFIFFIFGIIGVQLWAGVLRGRCAFFDAETETWVPPEPTIFCALDCPKDHPSCSVTFGDACGTYPRAYQNSTTGEWVEQYEQMSCKTFPSPNYDLTSFDNIGIACLTIFTSITLEGWVDVMYALNHAWGIPVFNAIYFIMLIMFGSFFLLNLALAVIWDEYVKAEEAEKIKAEEAAAVALQEELIAEAAADAAAAVETAAGGAEGKRGGGGAGGGQGGAQGKHQGQHQVVQDGPDGGAGAPITSPPDAAAGAAAITVAPAGGGPGEHIAMRRSSAGSYVPVRRRSQASVPEDPRKDKFLFKLVESSPFNAIIVVLILLNTTCLALEHYGMEDWLRDFLTIMNYIFTVLFFVEMVLKIMGLGPRDYVRSAFNVFDGIIVLISIVEIAVSWAGLEASSGLGALRTFRLMRVFKLARSWKDLRRLLTTIIKSVGDVANASVVLLIIMFIFCLLGMQLFGGKFDEEGLFDVKPRAHFDNIWWSFVTVFQVLTGENWNEVLYATVHAAGPVGIVYFVLLNVVGNYLILNLFLAILLGNFDTVDEEDEEDEVDKAASVADASVADDTAAGAGSAGAGAGADSQAKYLLDADRKAGAPTGAGAAGAGPDAGAGIGTNENKAHAWKGAGGTRTGDTGASALAGDELDKAEQGVGKGKDDDEGTPGGSSAGEEAGSGAKEYSLFLFGPENPVRLFVARVKTHRYFEGLILALIGISSIMLALDEPRVETCGKLPSDHDDSCKTLFDFLQTADLIITILFGCEMVIKIIAMGFYWCSNAYLSISWNRLDFVIVIVSFLSIYLGGSSQLKALRSLRALRALRPLRVVSRYPQLKLVVNSIFGSLPKVRNVMLVNMLFFLIFGIVGVQNWMGALNYCNDETIATKAECVGNFTVRPEDDNCHFLPTDEEVTACQLDHNGRVFPRVWQPHRANFDHVGQALLTVFEVASGEMWPDIMYTAVDAVGHDEPQERDNSPAAAIFFILINVVCAFFMLEIFTGVVIDNFNKMKEESQGSALLTPDQQMWVETMKMMLGTAPTRRMRKPPAKQVLRNKLFVVASSKRFELFIMALILLNSVVLAMRFADQDAEYSNALANTNLVFAGAFLVEAIIKIVAFGPLQYISVGWNRFDFILVLGSIVGVVADLGQLATLLRIVRVARIFRLIRTSQGLLTLFKTLLFSFPSLVNVGAVLILVYFIYAVVGMNLFADIKRGEFITDDANFYSFFITMITLFRMSTGESYNGIMHDCSVDVPYCDPVVADNCGIAWFAPLYFISFVVLTAFILLNLLVAIILDNFNDTVAMDEGRDGFALTDRSMEAFQTVWSRYDPAATRYIPVSNMVNVLLELDYPLGLNGIPGVQHSESLRKHARAMLADMKIPEHEGRVHFHEALDALARQACGKVQIDASVPILTDLEKQQTRLLRRVGRTNQSVTEALAAEVVQSTYRGHRTRIEYRHKQRAVKRLRAASASTSHRGDSASPEGRVTGAGIRDSPGMRVGLPNAAD